MTWTLFVWLVLVLGLVVYLATTHPKVSEVGRLMFFAALLAVLLMRMRFPGL